MTSKSVAQEIAEALTAHRTCFIEIGNETCSGCDAIKANTSTVQAIINRSLLAEVHEVLNDLLMALSSLDFNNRMDLLDRARAVCDKLSTDKHLVSEQGRDGLHGAVCDAVALLNQAVLRDVKAFKAHDILRQALVDYADRATTPPPASDERCVRCGHKRISYMSEVGRCVAWITDDGHACGCKCEFPAPSVPAGQSCAACAANNAQVAIDIKHTCEPAPSSGDAAALAKKWLDGMKLLEHRAGEESFLAERINALITTTVEATSTVIVGLVRAKEVDWHVQSGFADLIERTPLDELRKGGES